MADADTTSGPRRTKVERVLEAYDLQGIESELADRWTGAGRERQSLRELARFFNERVLAAALDSAGLETIDGDIANLYRLLHDDDVSAGKRTEARSRLEREGVDTATLESDFVSHQAIHTFLTDTMGVSLPADSADARRQKSRETVRKLRGRLQSVALGDLERLAGSDTLALGDPSVYVSLTVVCNDCGEQYEFDELLDEGGCSCEAPLD
jgi:hypothetical protein